MQKKENVHADARTWMVRIVAAVCALVIVGTIVASAFL